MFTVRIAKWYDDADSPIMFMVDDFCNVWVDLNGNGRVDLGEDWGWAGESPNSAFRFLKSSFLDKYPGLKITFFTPVGNRNPVIKRPLGRYYSAAINENEEARNFFRSLHLPKRFEVAYHGLNHGIPGDRTQDFCQEWRSFQSLKEAVEQTERGKKIYLDVFGAYPAGGKYCGYEHNEFSDESVNQTGFFWWCRDWSRGQRQVADEIKFEPRYFGANKVIDIPSTIGGDLLMARKGKNPVRYAAKLAFKPLWIGKQLGLIDELLRRKQIVSIQEHISPARADGKKQYPNIIDDRESLISIFEFLKNKNVWYATGSEIAEYFDARENTKIIGVSQECLLVKYTGKRPNPILTLLIGTNDPVGRRGMELVAPNGETFAGSGSGPGDYKITVRIMNGDYRIR